jgi:hypothetical protein
MKTNEKGTAVRITPHELALKKGHFLPSKQLECIKDNDFIFSCYI